MMKFMYATFCVILLMSWSQCLDPTQEIQLYPNTENSDSIYIYSFKLQNDIPSGSYILVNMDWYSSAIKPFQCIMVNTSIQVDCTNFATPLFPLTITVAKLHQHNQYLSQTKTVAVLLRNNLTQNTEYHLQLHLFNTVPNIRKISPSAELYVVSKDGLVYEENINYGSAINRPPIDNVLYTSVLNNSVLNRPGELSTFKAEFMISQPILTDYSAFTLVLHHPFSFSPGSTPRASASVYYSTTPIALYSKPSFVEHRVISPNIFYVVFEQKFVANRRFILEVTEINNPFFLAASNFSIYSMNYNSLTPLEGYEHGYMIQTVSYTINVTLNIPFNQPQTGPRVFYKNVIQYAKVDIIIPKDVPTGYSIRYVLTGGTIQPGTAYANFQSLAIDPVYTYGSNFLIISNVGQMLFGSTIQTTLKIIKDSVTGFSFDVFIDTDEVISAFNASDYLYKGHVDGTTITKNGFLNNIQDSVFSWSWTISQDVLSSTYLLITIYPQSNQDTSTGSYLDIYFSPNFIVDSDFNINADCRINNVAGSGICALVKSGSYLKLTVNSTTPNATNPFPKQTITTVYIYNIIPPRSTSNKYIYPCYFTLFKNGAPGSAQYYDTHIITVMPKYGGLTNLRMQQYNDKYYTDFSYPGFLRIESITPTEMNYTIQENQIRVIVLASRYGFKGMGTIGNQQSYPCTSNINVNCTFLLGHVDGGTRQQVLEWDKIVIAFPSNEENTNKFHVIIPDSVHTYGDNFWYHFVGVYNQLTKDYKYYYMKSGYERYSWGTGAASNNVTSVLNTGLYVDFGGRAGSYKSNVTVYVINNQIFTGDFSFLCISTSWSFYEKGISSINPQSMALTDPKLGVNESSPVSVYMSAGMYLTIIPILYMTGSATTFTIMFDNVHMPYSYDLPNYYIYFIDADNSVNGNIMSVSNEFIMTGANIFYDCPLKSLSISCLNNALGVKNTICTINFGTQNPLKADGNIRVVFSGMTVATDVCQFYSGSTLINSTCQSTQDNKNLTVSLSGWQHYSAGNFTLIVYGIGINATSISQSFNLYLYDSTKKYVIQKGNRILMTTIAKQKIIQVYEILYSYNSPLAYNKMSIRFYLPREIYSDEQFGFLMGKDLNDVNTEIKRLNIKIMKSDGTFLAFLYRLISTQYKVLFTFDDPSQLTEGNYTMEIYGIRTPASHDNGNFNIIYQRLYDLQYTLINQITASFPSLQTYIISNMSLVSYFNTEGYEQQIEITISNRAVPVNDQMIWVINFPSYYSPLIFNSQPYCLIENSPINCYPDPLTPYQLIVKNSPRIIGANISYKLTILGVSCPRVQYMWNIFPNRYIFIGILQNSSASYYEETTLIYPQQDVYNYIPGIIGVQNIQVSSTNLTSFYNTYMTIVLMCNVDILAGQYLYLTFPKQFDNFNNKPLNVILNTTSVIGTLIAPVLGRRLEILIPSTIPMNTYLRVTMTNVPTPTQEVTSQMSQIICFVSLSDKSQLTAASAVSGNSAPKLSFFKDNRYIQFNNDTEIVITAGTYSQLIDIKSSDSNPFLTNIKVTLSSVGFVFEPSEVLLKLGDDKEQFRIGADKDLYPVSYFYNTVKQEQVQTFYKITTNNNIRITNIPVTITLPSAISLPIGGCSQPLILKLTNPPTIDMSITFNYNNSVYNENVFYPNPHTTKSTITFTKDTNNNTLSFCTAQNVTGTQIQVTLILTGTNYNSYRFSPSEKIVFNLVSLPVLPSPTVQIQLINQQKTFVDFNLTFNSNVYIYYHLFIGDSPANVLSSEAIQVYLKSQVSVLESQQQFLSTIYLEDRDQRVGQVYYTAGQHTLRFIDMVPEMEYVFCVYLQNQISTKSGPFCQVIQTQSWGNFNIMSVKFSRNLTNFQLNKVICFFTKYLGTKTNYLVDIEGNSCNDNAVKNINFNFSSPTFTNQKKSTNIYLVTNPYLTSDSSQVAFENMFDSTNALTNTVLASALSGYGIDFMSGSKIKISPARATTNRTLAENLRISFSKPQFIADQKKVVISNVLISGDSQYGTIYFLLVKYKQFVTDPITNETSVKIRLNAQPTAWQMVNCMTWQNITAEGCARAVFSGTAVAVELNGVQQNSMYLLYYMPANEYPFRPVVGYTVYHDSIVTMNWGLTLTIMKISLAMILFLVLSE